MAQEIADRYILPKHVRPIHYDLQLEPDFNTCLIGGKARIEVEILEETEVLTINAINIKIYNVALTHGGIARVPKTTQFVYPVFFPFDVYSSSNRS